MLRYWWRMAGLTCWDFDANVSFQHSLPGSCIQIDLCFSFANRHQLLLPWGDSALNSPCSVVKGWKAAFSSNNVRLILIGSRLCTGDTGPWKARWIQVVLMNLGLWRAWGNLAKVDTAWLTGSPEISLTVMLSHLNLGKDIVILTIAELLSAYLGQCLSSCVVTFHKPCRQNQRPECSGGWEVSSSLILASFHNLCKYKTYIQPKRKNRSRVGTQVWFSETMSGGSQPL